MSGPKPDYLVSSGAQIVREPSGEPWYVLVDPQGNEFCAYPAVDDRPAGIFELVVKCSDAHSLARWWGRVLGGQVTDEGNASVIEGSPYFPWDYMVFDQVPGLESFGGRMRWQVLARDSNPFDLIKMGSKVLSKANNNDPRWLLSDPEGNEFFVTFH
ncbi:hypothetical protein GCM10009828_058080 [Actinoplanes couchii]|uniref:Glyoxalase-like domain-containing protein n=1 Tax=Actinoplanes couchii TaxID=403638 RepID=A0ABQ3XT65_9ACTN|nr:hypothetical protein Aco03nite_101120 [Actinoplanes couchii]